MQIYIQILDVGNADAIIIHLTKAKKHLVILLDGGRDSNMAKVQKALDNILNPLGKLGPDIIICTHFDFDHIGGLIELVNVYKGNIGQFYIHRTGELLMDQDSEHGLPQEDDLYIGADSMDFSEEEPALKIALEGLKHERTLLDILHQLNIPVVEPVAGSLKLKGWEEVELIAPSLAYYQELFPEHFEISALVTIQSDEVMGTEKPNYDPCQALDNLGGNHISNANLNSAILKITGDEGVFLFTGDAGIESFYEIPNYQQELSKIFWLKVPHHGSANNLNSDLIRLMSPKVAVISGKSRVSSLVVECLKRHSEQLDITAEKGDLEYQYGEP